MVGNGQCTVALVVITVYKLLSAIHTKVRWPSSMAREHSISFHVIISQTRTELDGSSPVSSSNVCHDDIPRPGCAFPCTWQPALVGKLQVILRHELQEFGLLISMTAVDGVSASWRLHFVCRWTSFIMFHTSPIKCESADVKDCRSCCSCS